MIFFNKHKQISSENEIANTLVDSLICRLTKVIDFFQEEKCYMLKDSKIIYQLRGL
jgi:hypothetical protein